MEILLTGSTGMLGKYLTKLWKEEDVKTIGRSSSNDIECDLSTSVPKLPDGYVPDLMIHAAGTESLENAFELNFDGTKNLLASLEGRAPKFFVFISSWQVYSPSAGENVDEDARLLPVGDAGKSKARAEEAVREWCGKNDVKLTIIRPATMFGSGMKGPAHEMFNEVISNRFVNIRGSNGRRSVVMALDVAEATRKLYETGGVYNLNDGDNPTFLELAEAMSANAGAMKRITHLPPKWASTFYSLGKWIPWVKKALDPETLAERARMLTFSNSKAEEAGCTFHKVTTVLSHEDPDYPYQDS